MSQPRLAFPLSEYAERLRRVRQAMAVRSLRSLFVTEPANIYYLTGYDAWSFYMPQGLYLPAQGDPLLFLREMDAFGASRICCLPSEQILGYPEHLVQHPSDHPMEWVAQHLLERGIRDDRSGPVGVESESPFFSVRSYQVLTRTLPGVPFVDSGGLVNWVRSVKSSAEVDVMRLAGRVAEKVMAVALDAVRIGRRQCDAAAEIVAAQASGTAEIAGDYPAIVPMMPTGEGSGTPHLTWGGERFAPGQVTVVEVAGVHQRYHAPIARTLVLGLHEPRLATTAGIVRDGMEAALGAVRPGATCEDVERAWRKVAATAGVEKPSRIGYSIGIGYPPDWGEGTMSLRPGDTTPLQERMAFHLILGLWGKGPGFELSQAFVVGPNGADPLFTFPRSLHVKEGT